MSEPENDFLYVFFITKYFAPSMSELSFFSKYHFCLYLQREAPMRFITPDEPSDFFLVAMMIIREKTYSSSDRVKSFFPALIIFFLPFGNDLMGFRRYSGCPRWWKGGCAGP